MSSVERMRELVEISQIVTGSDNFYEIKDLIITKMLNVVHPTKACVNLFYGNDYNYAHLVCSSMLDYIPKLFPKNEKYGSKINFSVYPKYIHEVVEKKEVVIVENIFEDERALGEEELAVNEGYIGRAVFPFVINGKTVGFMSCYLKSGEKLSDEDIDFISQVSSLMTLSISITEKNDGIKKLIKKLRNSIKNINKASRQLYSTKDMFYYLKKMASVLLETTDSEYSIINIYNTNTQGAIVGQKISVAEPDYAMNDLNMLMPEIIKSTETYSHKKELKVDFKRIKNIENYVYYKFIINTETELIVLCAGNKEYSTDDRNTITAISNQIALSMQSYEYLAKQEMHKDIDNDLSILKSQQKLLINGSNLATFSSKELFYYNDPAKVVGGDFFHANDVENRLVFIISDVMGHGIVSNYIVAMMKGAFDILSRYAKSPEEILIKMNNHLFSEFDKIGVYATSIVGFYDRTKREMVISNAGHYMPIMIDSDNKIVKIKNSVRGIPIGIDEDSTYSSMRFDVNDIKEICFFTDGILEMKNKDENEFGIEGLERFLLDNIENDKKDILSNLKNTIDSFVFNEEKRDDILVVFVK